MRKILNRLIHPQIRPQIRPLIRPFNRLCAGATTILPALGANVFALALLAAPMAPQQALAQNLFAPVITVNDDVVTNYELGQRILFLQLLNAPGDIEKLARQVLIEERLKKQALKTAEIEIKPEAVKAGIEEFAQRAGLSGDDFVAALSQGGVSPETLRDFVKMGIAWREFVSARFLGKARPTQLEIDRAFATSSTNSTVQVLLSEIIIPVNAQNQRQVQQLAKELSRITSYGAFSAAAGEYSASSTRGNGGRMNWLALDSLPPALQPVILDLTPGEVSGPIVLPQAIALFQMRGIRESGVVAPRYSSIDYAALYIPGGRSEAALASAAAIIQRIDTCNDLYGIAKDQPESTLDRFNKAPGEIPRDIALELAKMDQGETSTTITRSNGQTLVLLMLCGRTAQRDTQPTRLEVGNALTQERLNKLSDSFLARLKSEALIIER